MKFYGKSCFAQCPEGTFLDEDFSICYEECPAGMTPEPKKKKCRISNYCEQPSKYFNSASKSCDSCNSNCMLCKGKTDSDCLFCKEGQFLSISSKILSNPFFLKKYTEFIENPYDESFHALVSLIPNGE